jgi:multicomponent Na+:H+ antiporter subunit G
MEEILEITGGVFLIFGAMSLLVASIGLYRMPDFYNRIQIGTKASTFGALLSIIGVALIFPGWSPKLLAMLLFILFTNPISSHIVGRTAYFTDVPLSKRTKVDRLKEMSPAHLKKVKTKD